MEKDQIYYFYKKLLGTEIMVGFTSGIAMLCSVAVNGRLLSSAVLAAISLTITIDCIMKFAGGAIRQGSIVVMGRQMGKGNIRDINAVGISSLVCLSLVSIVMVCLVMLFPERLAELSGAEPGEEGFGEVVSYFRGYILSPVLNMFVGLLLTLMRLKGKTLLIPIATAEMMVGSLLFSLLNALCFGGTALGAGIAQSCAELIVVIHLFAVCIREDSIPAFSLRYFSIRVLKDILAIGVPLSAISLFLGFRNTLMNHLLYKYGGIAALSAKAIYSTVICFSDAFVAAVPAVAIIIAGIFAGEKNRDALVDLFRRSLKLGLVITLADMTAVILIAGPVAGLITADTTVSMYAGRFLRISVLAAPFEGIVVLLKNFYISLDHHRFASIINMFHCVILHVVYSLLLSGSIGMYGVMASYPLTEISVLGFLIIWAWIKNKGLHRLEDLVPLNGQDDSYPHLSRSVYSIEDVHSLMDQVQLFCTDKDISRRIGLWLQLCCEEMLVNILEYSFTKLPEGKGAINVFICLDEEKTIKLIIRDNGPIFDPGTIESIFYPEQPEKNVGIRLVQSISQDFVWQNVIGMNTLTIRLEDRYQDKPHEQSVPCASRDL